MIATGRSTAKLEFTNYDEWEATVPEVIRGDSLWSSAAYRKALFLYELVWSDCEQLMRDPRGQAIACQIVRSAGSIAANIEEGYGRGFSKDSDHFLRISIGSARETRGWYLRSRRLLQPEVITHRMGLAGEVLALLINELSKHRRP